MNDKQENKISMFWGVDSVFTKNQDAWEGLPAFVNAVAAFRTNLAAIQGIAQERVAPTMGVTAEKRANREEMELAALEVAGAVAAYASETANHDLLAKVDITDSDLRRARDTEITTICQGIRDQANTVVANLADYGVTAATLDALQTKVSAYGGTVGKPAMAKSSKQAAGVSLDGAIEAVDKVLDGRLDKMTQSLRRTKPTFFEMYRAARSIVDNRGRPAKPNGNGGTPAPGSN